MTYRDDDVVITGLGPVTSIGVGAPALWSALMAGTANVRLVNLLVDAGQMVTLPVATMPPAEQVPGLDRHLAFLDEQQCSGHRDLAYSMLAVEWALRDADLEFDAQNNDVGAVQAFEAPGVENTVQRLFAMMSTPPSLTRDGDYVAPGTQSVGRVSRTGPPQTYDALAPCFYNSQPFVYVHLLAKAFGLRGFSTSVHNACSSGAFALEMAADRIRTRQAEVMIVTGGEAFDTAVRLEWFRRLDLYASQPAMRPFARQPTGFYVGEGGAALVLESGRHARARGARGRAVYAAGAFAQQAWKQTVPDVRAGRLRGVIERALARAGLSAGELDLIVPHGAAGRVSDGYEATCLCEALRGEADSAVATTFKPAVGHMLAASALIETIGCLLAMEHECVPPMCAAEANDVEFPVPLAIEPTPRRLNTAMKLSTGFTGHDAALLFRRV